ncbi:extracellular solute-binding protein [bacterium]|nr:extracellular solute-binding protein [bacterium]MBU1873326.1 extracellular solute-binding protein [bacterium]
MTTGDKRGRYGFLFAIFIFAIIVVLVFNLISLNKDRFEKREVTKLYFADNISEAHLKIIHNFNEKYKGQIEVVPINLPFTKFTTNERKELIARSLRSRDSRIDIFAVDQIWVPRFAKWAEPLAKYFMQTDLLKIIPQALTTCYYDGVLLGIPLYIDIGVLYYREDLIRQAGNSKDILKKLEGSITWEELIKYGETVNKERPFYLFQGDNYEGLICNYLEILGGAGGSAFQNGNLKFYTIEGQRSAQFMQDLITRYKFSPHEVSAFIERESYLYAIENDAPFFRGWSSYLKDIDIQEQDSLKVKHLRLAYLPHFDGNAPVTVFGGWHLMISKYSEKKPEAFEFLRYVQSEEVQKIMFETSGYLPILKSIYTDPEVVQKYPYIEYLEEMMKSGIHRPALVNYTKISDILSFYLNKILKHEISVDEALRLVDETVASDKLFLR